MMSALTFNLVRLGYLILLWLFVLAAIGVLRRDLLTRGRAARGTKKAARAANGASEAPAVALAGAVGASDLEYVGADGYAQNMGTPLNVVGAPPGGGVLVPPVAGEPIVVGPGAAGVPYGAPISVGGGVGVGVPQAGAMHPGMAGSNMALAGVPQPIGVGPSALAVTAGTLAGTWLPLTTQAITIGRSPGNTLVLEDGYASSRHAQIFIQNGQWFIEDLNSTNGTLLGGQPVRGVVPLPLKVPIKIGDSEIELVS